MNQLQSGQSLPWIANKTPTSYAVLQDSRLATEAATLCLSQTMEDARHILPPICYPRCYLIHFSVKVTLLRVSHKGRKVNEMFSHRTQEEPYNLHVRASLMHFAAYKNTLILCALFLYNVGSLYWQLYVVQSKEQFHIFGKEYF